MDQSFIIHGPKIHSRMIGKLMDINGDSVVPQKIENVVVGCVIDFISRSTMDQKLGLNYSHEWCIQRRIIQKDVIQYSSRTFIQEMREVNK